MRETIEKELTFLNEFMKTKKTNRKFYQFSEMTPIEYEIYKNKKFKAYKKRKMEEEELERRNYEYKQFVTNEIMTRAPDLGVTIFMPHAFDKDLLKNVIKEGEKFRLAAKDKRFVRISADHLPMIDFERPIMPKVLFDFIEETEVYMICWKTADDELRSVEGTMKTSFFIRTPIS